MKRSSSCTGRVDTPRVTSTSCARPTTRRRLPAAVALTVAALLLTSCMIPEESSAFDLMNRDRNANGISSYWANEAAVVKAQNWATQLATSSGGVCSSAKLRHSNLADGAPAGWRALGENVGCTSGTGPWQSSVAALHAQFMNSGPHRSNILSRTYTHAGVGLSMFYTGPNSWVVYETQFFVQF